jgi:hypothetical protein
MAHHEVLPDALAAPKYRTRGTPPPYSLNDRRVSLDTLASSRIQRGPNLVNHSCKGGSVELYEDMGYSHLRWLPDPPQ